MYGKFKMLFLTKKNILGEGFLSDYAIFILMCHDHSQYNQGYTT